MIKCEMPKQLAAALEADTEFHSSSMAALIRRIIKWHRGASNSPGRHPEAQRPKYTIGGKRVSKSFLIDEEDFAHLDKLCLRSGIVRSGVLMLIVFQWFEIDPLPQTKK
tara:strand:- start:466 stop:792 length:327 start_codon:yes stop_codon:yes gene_type:complete